MSSAKSCCVPGCYTTNNTDIKLHHFPNPQDRRDMFEKWIQIIGGAVSEMDQEFVFKNRRVCERHFRRPYKYTKRLSTLAVPTLCLPGSTEDPCYSANIFQEHNYIQKPPVSEDSDQPSAKKYKANIEPEEPGCSWNVKDVEEINVSNERGDLIEDGEKDVKIPTEPDVEVLFSWVNTDDANIPIQDFEDGVIKEMHPDEILCNICQNVIPTGSIRVVCVTCWDYDVCALCAASGSHAEHYALLVPSTASPGEVRAVLQRVRQVLIGGNGELLVKDDDCVVGLKQEIEDPIRVPDINDDCLEFENPSEIFASAAVEVPNVVGLKQEIEDPIRVPDINDDCLEFENPSEIFASAAVEVPNREEESSIENITPVVLDASNKEVTHQNKRARILKLLPVAQDVAYTTQNRFSIRGKKIALAKISQNDPLQSGAQKFTGPTMLGEVGTNIVLKPSRDTDILTLAPKKIANITPIVPEKVVTNMRRTVPGKTVTNIRPIALVNRVTNITSLVQRKTVTKIKCIGKKGAISSECKHAVPEKMVTNINPAVKITPKVSEGMITNKRSVVPEKNDINTRPKRMAPQGRGKIATKINPIVNLIDLKYDKKVTKKEQVITSHKKSVPTDKNT